LSKWLARTGGACGHQPCPSAGDSGNRPRTGSADEGLGQRYGQYVNRTDHRTGTLFEGRVRSSVIEADSDLIACRRDIERNPVRACCPPRKNTPGRATAALRSDSSTPLSLRTRFIAFAPDIQTDLRVGADSTPPYVRLSRPKALSDAGESDARATAVCSPTNPILAQCALRARSSLEIGNCIPEPRVADRCRAVSQHVGNARSGAKRASEGAAGLIRGRFCVDCRPFSSVRASASAGRMRPVQRDG
jgi:putative transposase